MKERRLHIENSAEAERIRRIVGGSEEAFRSLVAEYHALAYSLAYRVLGDAGDAEEVAQDAFVRVHGAMASFRGEASLKTWILRIVHRLSLNRRRDRSRTAWHRLGLARNCDVNQVPPMPSGEPDPEARLISRQTRAQVMKAVDGLSPPLREVVVLSSLGELTYEEIARVLGVPVGTVSSRLHAARRQLADKLARQDLI